MHELKRKLVVAVLLIAALCAGGVSGYRFIEGWPLLDAAYMTVITLATVGYGEIHPLSPQGRIFTMGLIVFGMGTFIYGVSTITAFILEGELHGYLRRKKVKNRIGQLEGHYIICGSGNIGRYVIQELMKTGHRFVVVEPDGEKLVRLREIEGMLVLEGDPSEDRVLLEGGIEKAKGLVSALDSDRDNLFVVMTARSLNPKLRIVTRAIDECCAPKLAKAGADAVVSAESIGGMRMASELIRPVVVSFLDQMLRATESTLRVEEVAVGHRTDLVGKTLAEARIRDTTGLAVIAVKNTKSGKYTNIPPSSHRIGSDDLLIVIGSHDQVRHFRGN